MKILKKESFDFDDVNLLPNSLCITKHEDVQFDSSRLILKPIDQFNTIDFIKDSVRLGISVPILFKNSIEDQQHMLQIAMREKALFNSPSLLWLCVNPDSYQQIIKKNIEFLKTQKIGIYLESTSGNGFDKIIGDCLYNIQSFKLENIFAGNVYTLDGWKYLEDLNCTFIRVGPSNHKEIKQEMGIGRSQLSAIDEIRNYYNLNEANIVCDCDIENIKNIAKAFAIGADYIMINSILYNEGEINGINLEQKIKNIESAMKSCISYCGFTNLKDFIGQGIFERIIK